MMILEEDDDYPGRRSLMILAEDHDPGRKVMFLLGQYDSAGIQSTTVQGPPWDHLGTIFGKIRKLLALFWVKREV